MDGYQPKNHCEQCIAYNRCINKKKGGLYAERCKAYVGLVPMPPIKKPKHETPRFIEVHIRHEVAPSLEKNHTYLVQVDKITYIDNFFSNMYPNAAVQATIGFCDGSQIKVAETYEELKEMILGRG